MPPHLPIQLFVFNDSTRTQNLNAIDTRIVEFFNVSDD